MIVVDGMPSRLDMARQVGADEVVNFRDGDPVEQVYALVGEQEVPRLGYRGGNVDAVIDCAGAVNSSQQGLQMLKQENGRLVLVALFEHDGPLDRNMIVRKHVQLLGSWGSTAADLRHALELIASGTVDRPAAGLARVRAGPGGRGVRGPGEGSGDQGRGQALTEGAPLVILSAAKDSRTSPRMRL